MMHHMISYQHISSIQTEASINQDIKNTARHTSQAVM